LTVKNPRQLIEALIRDPDICDSGIIPNELLREFHRGYPIENLRLLLSSRNRKVVRAGIFIASELGSEAAPLLDQVLSLLRHPDPIVRFDAIDSMLTCTTSNDEKEIAAVVLMLDDSEGPVRRKVLDFLSRASAEQLLAGLRYLEKTEPDSTHVAGLRWLTGSGRMEAGEIASFIRSDNAVSRRYGVVAAAKMAVLNCQPLELASTATDQDLNLFAKDVLELTRPKR
jgi:hypothetical protein